MDSKPNPLLLAAIHQRIEIQSYDSEWPCRFAIERTRLLHLLPEAFQGIEHFGGTAVPGMAAKPVIDTILTFSILGRQVRKSPLGDRRRGGGYNGGAK
jgi:GrpB-like predicted nucleotidyltransferase (UPF0157 family)